MKKDYLKPQCNLVKVAIEQGFAASVNLGSGNPWTDTVEEDIL